MPVNVNMPPSVLVSVPLSGLAMGLQWACNGLAMGLQWACNGLAMGLQWACNGLAMGLHEISLQRAAYPTQAL
eukprot:13713947-Alexandrium_andersonii.AAC.1